MSEVAITVEGLAKKYLIGHKKSGDLREAFGQKMQRLFSKRSVQHEEFWALRDVTFQIKKGEAVGIIGRNGAGKSTLLKLLSRITQPTLGKFELNGRVSSLLEVGTGFHAELSGRENIFVNGTILGMRRGEIKAKFDQIVDFSGVEKFIDTPVKHYSSGMKVRLAFSVAAHLEPEILIVDEVLAVGDAEFQKKCLGKMDEASKHEGRTVIFVSHNMAALTQLCQRGIVLANGKVMLDGEVNTAVHEYINQNKKSASDGKLNNLDLRKGNGLFRVKQIEMLNEKMESTSTLQTGCDVFFQLILDRKIRSKKGSFRIDLAIDNEHDMRVAWFSSDVVKCDLKDEFQNIILKIPRFQFGGGSYYLTFHITLHGDVVDYVHQAYAFSVEDGDFFGTGKIIPQSQTFIYVDHEIKAV